MLCVHYDSIQADLIYLLGNPRYATAEYQIVARVPHSGAMAECQNDPPYPHRDSRAEYLAPDPVFLHKSTAECQIAKHESYNATRA